MSTINHAFLQTVGICLPENGCMRLPISHLVGPDHADLAVSYAVFRFDDRELPGSDRNPGVLVRPARYVPPGDSVGLRSIVLAAARQLKVRPDERPWVVRIPITGVRVVVYSDKPSVVLDREQRRARAETFELTTVQSEPTRSTQQPSVAGGKDPIRSAEELLQQLERAIGTSDECKPAEPVKPAKPIVSCDSDSSDDSSDESDCDSSDESDCDSVSDSVSDSDCDSDCDSASDTEDDTASESSVGSVCTGSSDDESD